MATASPRPSDRLALDRAQNLGNLFGSDGTAFGQFAHFIGDDGEAPAMLAGARRLDGRVERKQIGLIGEIVDDIDDLRLAKSALRGFSRPDVATKKTAARASSPGEPTENEAKEIPTAAFAACRSCPGRPRRVAASGRVG